ncbi:Hypothetical_protein [Hexamita inflata]|uniref:Hypothetical_protein n=1 Tax=Hexamita inflata TaxID=28002 RepID=A0AA86U9X3_9EUKA|nr:Hypothetical protein HINF_LOCUS30752 [Hexamita inflata]
MSSLQCIMYVVYKQTWSTGRDNAIIIVIILENRNKQGTWDQPLPQPICLKQVKQVNYLIDPHNEERRQLNEIQKYSALKHSCREIGSKFSIQYLENYDQISRQLKQPSIIKNAHDYLDHSSYGKTDIAKYIINILKYI